MAWIKTVPPERATGMLKRLYDEAARRARTGATTEREPTRRTSGSRSRVNPMASNWYET